MKLPNTAKVAEIYVRTFFNVKIWVVYVISIFLIIINSPAKWWEVRLLAKSLTVDRYKVVIPISYHIKTFRKDYTLKSLDSLGLFAVLVPPPFPWNMSFKRFLIPLSSFLMSSRTVSCFNCLCKIMTVISENYERSCW